MSTSISEETGRYLDGKSLSRNEKGKYFKVKEVELFQVIFE